MNRRFNGCRTSMCRPRRALREGVNYWKQMHDDVYAAIDEIGYSTIRDNCSDEYEAVDWLNDELWADDAVTGNGSGSYTFNSAVSLDHVMSNFGDFEEAVEEFGYVDLEGWVLDTLKRTGNRVDEDIFYDYMDSAGVIDWEQLLDDYGLADAADVTTRCYMLPEVLTDVVSKLANKIWPDGIRESRRRNHTGKRRPVSRRGRITGKLPRR